MRILHLSDRLSSRGGAFLHLLGVLHDSAAMHEVALAVGRVDRTAKPPCPVEIDAALAERTPSSHRLDRLVRRIQPDLIHVHNVVNPSVLEWCSEHPAVMTVQDHRGFCPGRGKWKASNEPCRAPMKRDQCAACFDDEAYFAEMAALTERRLHALQRLAKLTVLSHYMKQELVACGVSSTAIEVIPPFVFGLEQETEPSGPPCVLFVGRLVQSKGVEDALLAWKLSGSNLPLVFAGTGSARKSLEREGARVLGWVARDQLSSVYRRARVLVLPSRWQEPFGIVGLEALALGVPVAAYDSGGIREWHPGPGLVPWGDVEALAAAIRELEARGGDLHSREHQAAALPANRFAASDLMARLFDVYQTIAAR